MIEESGRVVAAEQGAIWVETMRQSACDSCSIKSGCGQGVLSRLFNVHKHHVRVLCQEAIKVNDHVVIGVSENIIIRSSMMLYLLPIILLLAGAVLGNAVSANNELFAIGSALIGMSLGFLMVKWHGNKVKDNVNYQPVFIKKLSGVDSVSVAIVS